MDGKTTETLTNILKSTRPEHMGEFLREHGREMRHGDLVAHMNACLTVKGIKKRELFIQIGVSEGYGYKLLSGEKAMPNADTLLRFCIGMGMGLDDTQKALELAGFARLYAREKRDAVLINALATGECDVYAVNERLEGMGLAQLKECTRE